MIPIIKTNANESTLRNAKSKPFITLFGMKIDFKRKAKGTRVQS